MSAHQDLHGLAACVHAALVTLHGLGLIYGLKRKNYGDALIHAGAGTFSIQAAVHHLHAMKGES